MLRLFLVIVRASTLALSKSSTRSSQKIPKTIIQFGNVFRGIGRMEGKVTIRIQAGAHPVVHPPRRVPFSLTEKLQGELDCLVGLQIIRKVQKPTEWVNSIVVEEKRDGSIRLSLDPKQLNEVSFDHIIQYLPSKTSQLNGYTNI